MYMRIASFRFFKVFQGNAATYLRCGWFCWKFTALCSSARILQIKNG